MQDDVGGLEVENPTKPGEFLVSIAHQLRDDNIFLSEIILVRPASKRCYHRERW